MSTYLKGLGTILAVDFADSASFTTVAQRAIIDWSRGSTSTIEVSHLDSTRKEYIGGLPDSGTISFDIWFDPDNSTHDALEDWHAASVEHDCRLTLTDSTPTTYTFAGILTDFSTNGMEPEAAIKASITIQITGATTKA